MNNEKISNGLTYLIAGFKSLNLKPYRLLVWLPFVISLALLFLLGSIAIHELGRLINWMLYLLPNWLDWLQWLVWIVGIILMLLIFTFTFTFIVNLIVSPFYGLLAEKVAKLHSNEQTPQLSFHRMIIYNLKLQLRLLGFYLPRALGCFILSFIPIIQIAAAPTWFALNAWLLAWQYLGYTMENHYLSFDEMKKQLKQQKFLTLSFGSVINLLMFIPILNLFVMPAAVIGGTKLWLDHYSKIS